MRASVEVGASRKIGSRPRSRRLAAKAGVDGVLVVDYPPEECEAFAAAEMKAPMPWRWS
jgi:hypothetical protein